MSAPVAAKKAVAKKTTNTHITKANGRKTVVKRTNSTDATGSKNTTIERSTGKTTGAKLASGKRSWMPTIRPAKSTVRYRQILVAELLISLIIVLVGLNKGAKAKDFSDRSKQAAAILVTFLILSLMTSAGPSAARVSASLGGVILLTLMLQTVAKNPTAFDPIKNSDSIYPAQPPSHSGPEPTDPIPWPDGPGGTGHFGTP